MLTEKQAILFYGDPVIFFNLYPAAPGGFPKLNVIRRFQPQAAAGIGSAVKTRMRFDLKIGFGYRGNPCRDTELGISKVCAVGSPMVVGFIIERPSGIRLGKE